jgi:hypothetical protein
LSALLVISLALACVWAPPAGAQPTVPMGSPAAPAELQAVIDTSLPFSAPASPEASPVTATDAATRFVSADPLPTRRPPSLPVLYGSFAVLQALDIHSTLSAVHAGGHESNPAVKGLVGQPAAFVAVKVAASVGTVSLTERLWKKHRTAAVVLMVVVNGTYATIVASNYRGRAAAR